MTLSLNEEVVLRTLYEHGGQFWDKSGRATTLLHKASGLDVTQAGLVYVLDRMEAKNLIVRQRNSRRTFIIKINPDLPTDYYHLINKPVPEIEVHEIAEAIKEPDRELWVREEHPLVSKITSVVVDVVETLQDQINSLQSELNDTRSKMTRYQEGYMPLKTERDSLRDLIVAKDHEISGLRQRLREAERTIKTMEEDHRAAVARAVREARTSDLDRIMREPPKAHPVGD